MGIWLTSTALACSFLAAALAALGGRGRLGPARGAWIAAGVTGVGFAAAVAAAVLVLGFHIPPDGMSAFFPELRVDALSALLTAFVLGLSAVIQAFALRYLRADRRQGWFAANANLVCATTGVMVCAGTVIVFGVAWIAAGLALVLLLRTYPQLAQARDGARRALLSFAVADAALILALAVIVITGGGDVPLTRTGDVLRGIPAGVQVVIALLLVLPALARSSQLPFSRWLPATLAAPTPVSALMHAGVVNAGAILLIRFAPVIGISAPAMALVFVAGAATVATASIIRLVKPDVKGRLVYSTMAQMGYLILACGLGAFPAAVFHLVAHGMFKSALFLGAGSGVRRGAVTRQWPVREKRTAGTVVVAIALAVVVSAGSLAGAHALLAPQAPPATLALLAFAAFTGAVTLASTLIARFTAFTVLVGCVALAALAFGYTAFVALFETILPFPVPVAAVSPWWMVAPAILLVAIQLLTTRSRGFERVRNVLYARSLAVGIPSHPTMPPPRARAPRTAMTEVLS